MKIKILILMMLILSGNVLFGQVGYNEEFQISDNIDGDNYRHSVHALNNGNFVVLWKSDRGVFNSRYYLKIYDNFGKLLCDEIEVNSDYDGSESYFYQFSDRFIVYWWGSDYNGITAQIFDLNGNKIGKNFEIAKTRSCKIVSSDNKLIYSWIEWNNNSEFRIVAANSDFGGNIIKNEVEIVEYGDYKSVGSIIPIYDNNLLFCLNEETESGIDIVARIYDENIEAIGDVIKINTFDSNDQIFKAYIQLDDKFLVIWECKNRNGYYGQYLDYNCNKLGEEIEIISDVINVSDFKVTTLTNNNFVVYYSIRDDQSYKFHIRVFDEESIEIGTENKYATNDLRINVVPNLFGGYFVIWDDDQYTGQLFSSVNEKLYNEFKVVKKLDAWGNSLRTCVLSNGNIVLLYQNKLSGYMSLYSKIIYNEPVQHELNDFHLLSPQMDETISFTNPLFDWKSTSNEHRNFHWDITYDFYLSNNENFDEPIIYPGVDDTKLNLNENLEKGQIYYWKVQAVNWTYDSLWSSNVNGFFVSNAAVTDVESEPIKPTEFSLHQNYPNPFNPTTMINYQLPVSSEFELTVYNNLGKKVATLVDENKQAGSYSVNFDATGLSSGIYFYRLVVGRPSTGSGQGYVETKKMVFCK